MKAIRARLIAILAGFILARLATWGLIAATPEATAELAAWLDHAFELLFLLGYAVIHPWIQKRVNPTGAMTADSARELERLTAPDPTTYRAPIRAAESENTLDASR